MAFVRVAPALNPDGQVGKMCCRVLITASFYREPERALEAIQACGTEAALFGGHGLFAGVV
jgi:hypothetical protein